MLIHKIKHLALLGFISLLTACGGGGGGSSDSGSAPETSSSFSGQVIDGYIKGMMCSADIDNDGVGDIFATNYTDSQGNYTIPGLSENSQATIICEPGNDGAEDIDRPGVPFIGTLTAPPGYSKVTPISTLVSKLVNNGKSLNEAEVLTRSFLGLRDSQELDVDFIANGDNAANTAAQAVHDLISNIDSTEDYSELVDALAQTVIEKNEAQEELNISDEVTSELVKQKSQESSGSGTITEPEDTLAPIITLNGLSVIEVTKGVIYIDSGATASDNVDGDLTDNIITTSSVDTNKVGTYTITYNVIDTAGNKAEQVIRTVHITSSSPVSELDSSLLPPPVPSF